MKANQLLIEEKDKQLETLTKEYNEVVQKYKAEQSKHEQVLDHIMKKVEVNNEKKRPKTEERKKITNKKEQDKSKSIDQVKETLVEYLEKRFEQIDGNLKDKMKMSILEAHKKRKEMKKTHQKGKRKRKMTEESKGISESLAREEGSQEISESIAKEESKAQSKKAPENKHKTEKTCRPKDPTRTP